MFQSSICITNFHSFYGNILDHNCVATAEAQTYTRIGELKSSGITFGCKELLQLIARDRVASTLNHNESSP